MNCASCGAELPEGAMFCGNCGRAVNAVTLPRDRLVDPRPGDTTMLPPNLRSADAGASVKDADPRAAREPSPAETSAAPGTIVTNAPPVTNPPIVTPGPGGPPAPPAAGHHWAASEADIPTGPIPPVPYVLSFSTGERIVVVGTGLLGRRPFAQPNERFDQIVSIADHERSVSKTHLEFGVENGELWVCDRYSANGTVIIPPAGGPHRGEPGRRYRVPRGARVEIGDHWFDVR